MGDVVDMEIHDKMICRQKTKRRRSKIHSTFSLDDENEDESVNIKSTNLMELSNTNTSSLYGNEVTCTVNLPAIMADLVTELERSTNKNYPCFQPLEMAQVSEMSVSNIDHTEEIEIDLKALTIAYWIAKN
jgi:hypothetical protein